MTAEQTVKLEELGVNIDETLERFVDNEDLYFRCLNKLVDDKNYDNMNLAIEKKDPQAAFDAAHALKGVTANLGLDKLFKEMRIITEVFRAGSLEYDTDNMSKLRYAYDEAIDTIKNL